MRLIHSPSELSALLKANAPEGLIEADFDAAEWLGNFNNIALAINNDLAMFEHQGGDSYQGHVWFESRGKAALEHGRAIIAHLFDKFGATHIYGETPAQCRAALRFVGQLGFVAYDEAARPSGKVVLSLLSGNCRQP